jgi:hypothetical protein
MQTCKSISQCEQPSHALAKTTAPLPATYTAAKAAIAECRRIDECKDWADKVAALAAYARQAKDETLEHDARRIRARAVKRSRVFLKQIDSDKRANLKRGSRKASARLSGTREKTGHDAGMSEHDIKTALRVASIPDDRFEQQVQNENPPTIEVARQGVRQRDATKRNATNAKRRAP